MNLKQVAELFATFLAAVLVLVIFWLVLGAAAGILGPLEGA